MQTFSDIAEEFGLDLDRVETMGIGLALLLSKSPKTFDEAERLQREADRIFSFENTSGMRGNNLERFKHTLTMCVRDRLARINASQS